MSTSKVGTKIMTATGKYFDFLKPEDYTFEIESMAHALSLQCRWTGNCKVFYSIAEHSVRCSYVGPPEHALARLMHDGVESVMSDLATPMKHLLPEYKRMELAAEVVLFKQFGIPFPMHPSVKVADLILLATEKRDIMGDDTVWDMLDGVAPLAKVIKPWGMEKARRKFIARYYELTGD